MTLRPLGLKGRDARHDRLSLGVRHTMPSDYQPGEHGYPNLQHARHWLDQLGSSCVGHGAPQGWEIGKVRHGGSATVALSRQHAYVLGLMQQNPPGTKHFADEGTYIDYVLSAFKHGGCCAESRWPETDEHVAKRPPPAVEATGLEVAGGDFWQLNSPHGEPLWREVCWAIDTFGAVIVGKQVGSVFVDHFGDSVIPAPAPTEVSLGGHCTVYVSHRNHGAQLLELNSWHGWGFKQDVLGDDGVTRQFDSLAWVAREWLWSPWIMNCWVWVP